MKKKNSKPRLTELLQIGDRRTTGAVDDIVSQFATDKSILSELVGLLDETDSATLMRAFDALEKVTRSKDCALTKRQTEKIFEIGFESKQQEVLWHWCQILPRLNLDKNQIEEAFGHMNSLRGSKSKIVWTFALQGMVDLAESTPSLMPLARAAIEDDLKTGSAAVQARCRLLLNNINS